MNLDNFKYIKIVENSTIDAELKLNEKAGEVEYANAIKYTSYSSQEEINKAFPEMPQTTADTEEGLKPGDAPSFEPQKVKYEFTLSHIHEAIQFLPASLQKRALFALDTYFNKNEITSVIESLSESLQYEKDLISESIVSQLNKIGFPIYETIYINTAKLEFSNSALPVYSIQEALELLPESPYLLYAGLYMNESLKTATKIYETLLHTPVHGVYVKPGCGICNTAIAKKFSELGKKIIGDYVDTDLMIFETISIDNTNYYMPVYILEEMLYVNYPYYSLSEAVNKLIK